jgi:hypothetical protein
MSTAAIEWLRERAADVPPELQARMELALLTTGHDDAAAADVAHALAQAAVSCLRDALTTCEHRRAALPLLAADALITAAFEAAADRDPAAVAALCAEYDALHIEAVAAS